MNERVVEILVFIMNHIRGDKSNLNNLELLSQDLLSKGYSQNEISSAFSWLFERIRNNFEEIVKNEGPGNAYAFRVLHELEAMMLTPAAHGYLLQLKELEILDEFDMEQAIERAMLMGNATIDLAEVKEIVASILAQGFSGMNGSYFIQNDSSVIH